MLIVIMKNGECVDAFYKPKAEGYIVLDADSPLAFLYQYCF